MSDLEALTSNNRPATDALITIRIIKSFPYRNVKNIIIKDIDLKSTTPHRLLEQVHSEINTAGALRPYRNVSYDSMKIYTQAHGSKSMNLVINFEKDDEWVLLKQGEEVLKGKSLWDLNVRNETEISVFNWDAYLEFKKNPEEKW
ncbi:hypothetical protein PVL30_000924 [Lodderomyces elongisporus]|uniref:Altered inheritance rate of mitochondria protein 29 n=1 Tax=Lodderomyces elongisporus (strain ATCC 11503 / CBS 2605 / JCM 1781 / NBRC 1676 / NRRL YB-4239) TaxID=379508 RepID=A5DUC6_LODEL|nr:uncharacterized protein PVL30_000924 [Lodderomyces elongisporus]EDK42784.1 conserved hypothetical protein [Lodderomyces elongisporus NRRL YB-4239]WLF77215.1 hypothetical protein PVL30_000924 [Lodderomyces elongisporus]